MPHKYIKPCSPNEFKKWFDTASIGSEKTLGGINGFQAKRNKLTATFRIRYVNSANKQKYYRIGSFPSLLLPGARKIAEKKYAAITMGIDIQEEKKSEKRDVSNTLDFYLDNVYITTARTQSDGLNVIKDLKNHFKQLLNKPLDFVDSKFISNWQISLLKKGFATRTIRKHFNALKTVLNHAVKSDSITENPLNKITLLSMYDSDEYMQKKSENRRLLTKDEIKKLRIGLDLYQRELIEKRRNSILHGKKHLNDISEQTYANHVTPMILMLFYTAMRPSDLRSLQWEHIDLERKTITKILNKNKRYGKKITIPLIYEAIETLQKWAEQSTPPLQGLVFKSPITGGELNKDSLRKPWLKIKKLANLPENLQMYTFRHHLPSSLIMNGVDLLTVSKILGHSNTKMVEEHYGHLSKDHIENSINKYKPFE